VAGWSLARLVFVPEGKSESQNRGEAARRIMEQNNPYKNAEKTAARGKPQAAGYWKEV
jgi:hypothetical protein